MALPFMKFNTLFCVLIALGLIFFVVWASKNLSKDKLKRLWIWMLAIGAVGCLLTTFGSRNRGHFYKEIRGSQGKYSVRMEMKRDKGMKISNEDFDKTMNDIRVEMRKRMREDDDATVESEG